MKYLIAPVLITLLLMMSCTNNQNSNVANVEKSGYFDYSNSDDQITGRIKIKRQKALLMSIQNAWATIQKGRCYYKWKPSISI
jgi:hypothetical protein